MLAAEPVRQRFLLDFVAAGLWEHVLRRHGVVQGAQAADAVVHGGAGCLQCQQRLSERIVELTFAPDEALRHGQRIAAEDGRVEQMFVVAAQVRGQAGILSQQMALYPGFLQQVEQFRRQTGLVEDAEQQVQIASARGDGLGLVIAGAQFGYRGQCVAHAKAEGAALAQAELFHDQHAIAAQVGCVEFFRQINGVVALPGRVVDERQFARIVELFAGLDVEIAPGDAFRKQREGVLGFRQQHHGPAGYGSMTSTMSATACCTVASSEMAVTMATSAARRGAIPALMSSPA